MVARLAGRLALIAVSLTAAAVIVAPLPAARDGSARAVAKPGGVYRVAYETGFSFTDGFDPTGEYLNYSFGIYSNLLVRTLVGYNHVAGPAGNKLVPDVSTAVPKPTNGGKTYTFHLKPGVKFGPPVGREVTAQDFLYAFERLAKPKDGAEYSFYYQVIKGFSAYGAGKAKTISGIQTPDPHTIVFNQFSGGTAYAHVAVS